MNLAAGYYRCCCPGGKKPVSPSLQQIFAPLRVLRALPLKRRYLQLERTLCFFLLFALLAALFSTLCFEAVALYEVKSLNLEGNFRKPITSLLPFIAR